MLFVVVNYQMQNSELKHGEGVKSNLVSLIETDCKHCLTVVYIVYSKVINFPIEFLGEIPGPSALKDSLD